MADYVLLPTVGIDRMDVVDVVDAVEVVHAADKQTGYLFKVERG
jgi:hypothetical protein